MRRSAGALGVLLALFLWAMPGIAAGPPRIAVFDFELMNTSPAPSTAEELARTRRLGEQLRAALQNSGKYQVVDIGPVRAEAEKNGSLRNCNGCELPLARRVGAALVAYGWVQKVSNLILNINLVIEDVAAEKTVKAGSVDIRGNTDESWSRGLKYLLEEHILQQ